MRFSRDAYHRMADAGIERVELLDGAVTLMSPLGPRHAAVVFALDRFFQSHVEALALCRVQSPICLDEHSEPQPDLVLARPRADLYRNHHPTTPDVLLLIEVADATVEFDLGPKLELYARAGIQEYWVFDLVRRRLIVHRGPSGGRYGSAQELGRTASIAPAAIPRPTLDLADVLPV
ncbi:MAG: hypothetical protein CHACPFDD_04064 [Phycisphaerae bacterium]|nr:hypothetical protein [Phycisphaerae bacterium]